MEFFSEFLGGMTPGRFAGTRWMLKVSEILRRSMLLLVVIALWVTPSAAWGQANIQYGWPEASIAVSEADGWIVVRACRTEPGSLVSGSVRALAESSTAIEGVDFEFRNSSLTFRSGETISSAVVLQLNRDDLIEGEEVVQLSLEVAGVTNFKSSPISIRIADYGGTETNVAEASFTTDYVRVLERDYYYGYSASVQVQLDRPAAGSVGIIAVPITADTNDFRLSNVRVDWPITNSMAARSFYVEILQDELRELDEAFELHLVDPVGLMIGSQSNLTVVINGNDFTRDEPWVEFKPAEFGGYRVAVAEGRTVEVTVEVTGGPGPVGVDFFTEDRTAVAGSDYVSTNGTLTWTAEDREPKVIQVMTLNDEVEESGERFDLVLTNAIGGAISAGHYEVSIYDSSFPYQLFAGAFGWTTNVYRAAESDRTLTVQLCRTVVTNEVVGAIGFDEIASTADRSDFVLLDQAFRFDVGETLSTPVEIRLTADGVDEPEESIVLHASLYGSYEEAKTELFATVRIIDSPGGALDTLGYASAQYTAQEGMPGVLLEVVKQGTNNAANMGFPDPVSTLFSLTGRSRSRVVGGFRSPFIGPAFRLIQTNLTWLPGDASSRFFFVELLEDLAPEEPTEHTLPLSAPFGAVLGVNSNTTLTITDNDLGHVEFTDAVFAVTEGEVAMIGVRRTDTNLVGTVRVQLFGYSATELSDYVVLDTDVTWSPGETELVKHIAVPTFADGFIEDDEVVSLSFPQFSWLSIGTNSRAFMLISDPAATNRTAAFAFGPAVGGSESADDLWVAVDRIGGQGQASVRVSSGTGAPDNPATPEVDYVPVDIMLNWEPDTPARQWVRVPLINDNVPEDEEFVRLNLSDPVNGRLSFTAKDVGIQSDELVPSVFPSVPRTILESQGTFTITLWRGPQYYQPDSAAFYNGRTEVRVRTTNSTPREFSSFVPIDELVAFEPGETNRMVTIQLVDDDVHEAPECLFVETTIISGGQPSLAPRNSLVCIDDDDDGGGIEFLSFETSVLEGDGHARVGLVRDGAGFPASVGVITAPQSAQAGVDFVPVTNTVTWLANDHQRIKYIDIPILDDSGEESDETFDLLLEPDTNTIVQNLRHTVQIHDDDGTNAPFGAVFSAGFGFSGRGPAPITINEQGGVQPIYLNRRDGYGPASVGYRLVSDTATVGVDVEPAEGRVTWESGDQFRKQVSVSVIDDSLAEGDESLQLILFDPVGGRIEQPTNTVTLSEAIMYTEDMVEFLETNHVVTEGGIVEIRLQRRAVNGRLEVGLQFVGNAAGGFDFGLTNGSIVWEEGDTSPKSVLLFVHEDGLIEPTETLEIEVASFRFVRMANPFGFGNVPTNPPPMALVTILDSGSTNALPRSVISLATNRFYVRENQEFVEVQVTRHFSDGFSSVELVTDSGSATAGQDFAAVSTNLVFPPGGVSRLLRSVRSAQTSGQTVVVPIPLIDDQLVESNEVFSVSLRNASNATVLADSANVILEDDESPATLQFAAPSLTVVEGAPVLITLTREGTGSGYFRLDFQGGSAGSQDYVPLTDSGVIHFPPGNTNQFFVQLLPTVDDSLVESNETIQIRLSPAGGNFSFGSHSNLTVTIIDNDSPSQPPVVEFAGTRFVTVPGATNAQLILTRSGAAPALAAVNIHSFTAIFGRDFGISSQQVRWLAGEPAEKILNIPIFHPLDAALTAKFHVSLRREGNVQLGTNSSAEVIIRRTRDPVTLSFGQFVQRADAGNMDADGNRSTIGAPSFVFAGNDGIREFRNWFQFIAPTNLPTKTLCQAYFFFLPLASPGAPTNLTYQIRHVPHLNLIPPTNNDRRRLLFQAIGNAPEVAGTNILIPQQSLTFAPLPLQLAHQWLRQPGQDLVLGGTVAGAANLPRRLGVFDTANVGATAVIALEYCDVLAALDAHRSAVRILPAVYAPGQSLIVRINAGPLSGTQSYALEDQLPAGWFATNVSHGGVFDQVAGKVKFGPYHDNLPRALHYELFAPANVDGDVALSGVISVDGTNFAITGDHLLRRQAQHPADRSPADWQMVISEVTAYGNAWRSESVWPTGPNPIPIDYVTSAAWLWRKGEQYQIDTSFPGGPLRWTPIGVRTPASLSGALIGAASSDVPGGFQNGRAIDVNIVVTPPSGIGGWAVEEDLPDGWTVSAVSGNGSLSSTGNRLKWGPFLDAGVRTLSYRLLPSSASAEATISGRASFDGRSVPIDGRRQLRRGAWISAKSEQANSLRSEGFRLRWRAQAGHRSVAEYTTDFVNWRPLPAGALQAIGDELELTDSDSTGRALRFYRIREVPE